MNQQNNGMDRELPKTASKFYAIGEMNGWRVKVVWADGPFTWNSKTHQTSLSLRFSKRGQVPCAACWLDDKWDVGLHRDLAGILRTQKNFIAYLNGELDVQAEFEKIYPPKEEGWDTPVKNEFVIVGKVKMTLEEFHRQAKPYVKRQVPDWVKDKKK